jgi:hypothetical protein
MRCTLTTLIKTLIQSALSYLYINEEINMKFTKTLILLSGILLFSNLYATAETYESRYTSLLASKCITLHEEQEFILQECPGFAGYQLHLSEADLRQSITLLKDGKAYPLQFGDTVSPLFSTLGTKAEWRFITNNRKLSPLALITRLNVVTGEQADQTTSWLVVSKITVDKICVVGKIRPQRDGTQNQKARDMADKSTQMACIK